MKSLNFHVWNIRKQLDLDNHHGILNIATYALGIGVVIVLARIMTITGWKEYLQLPDFSYLDALYTQLSITFIVISLTTILSSNTKIIYWTDKIELTLVKPIFSSFSAYATYIFACLTLSVIWTIKQDDLILISFGCSILVMTSLTFKLIEVYFGSSKVKQTLEWYFQWQMEYSEEEYKETSQKMIAVMTENMAENDFYEFFENFDFIYKLEQNYQRLYRVMEICANHNPVLLEQILKYIWDIKTAQSRYPKLLEPGLVPTLSNMKSHVKDHYEIVNCITDIEEKINDRA